MPKVATAAVLAADDGKPPPMLIVVDNPKPPAPDEKIYLMDARVTWAKSWAEVATGKPLERAAASNLDAIYKWAREGHLLGRPPEETFALGTPDKTVPLALESIGAAKDDPPPPEEEDLPDDGEETGGTGTAMALGKVDLPGTRPEEAALSTCVTTALGGSTFPKSDGSVVVTIVLSMRP